MEGEVWREMCGGRGVECEVCAGVEAVEVCGGRAAGNILGELLKLCSRRF